MGIKNRFFHSLKQRAGINALLAEVERQREQSSRILAQQQELLDAVARLERGNFGNFTDIKEVQKEEQVLFERLLCGADENRQILTREIHSARDQVTGLIRAKTEEMHQDLIQCLRRVHRLFPENPCVLETAHPLAVQSADHLYPHGTRNDNTRCPRFCRKCEQHFGRSISYLDIGCAGGGLVFDFLERGHFALGLEGSDFSLLNQRAEWPVIAEYLYTCDITKPFDLKTPDGKNKLFDVIGLWEVFEHIQADDLPVLLDNLKKHMHADSRITASVATTEDVDPDSGAVYHVTVHDRDWWMGVFERYGLVGAEHGFTILDFPRGAGNGPMDWNAQTNPEWGFHVVLRKA